jgi:hypothetical protein
MKELKSVKISRNEFANDDWMVAYNIQIII